MNSAVIKQPQRITIRDNRSEGIINYGDKNNYPQVIRKAGKSSGRTTQCLNITRKFYRGKGLPLPFYKTVINEKGLTVDKAHRAFCDDKALYRGLAAHVNRDMNGKIVSITPIPFEELRIGLPDEKTGVIKIKHHVDWGRETGRPWKREDITEFDLYSNDPKVISEQVNAAGGFDKWKGQILYWSANGYLKYPEASCDPVIEDVVSDDEAKQFRLNNITTQFIIPKAVKTPITEDDEERQRFRDNLENFQGARNASKLLHIEGGIEDMFEDMNINSQDGIFKETEDSVKESIRQCYGIEVILLSDQVAGKLGANQQEMQDAYASMNAKTVDDRTEIEELLVELFTNWHDESHIKDLNNFVTIPLSFGEERILVEKLGVGGTQAMQAILIDSVLQQDQKIQILIQVFGISEDNAKLMVPKNVNKPDPITDK